MKMDECIKPTGKSKYTVKVRTVKFYNGGIYVSLKSSIKVKR